MSHTSSRTLVGIVGCLLVATAMVCAGNAAPTQPVATIVSVEGATTTYQSQDWNGQTVTVQVPSHASEDIKGRDAQGSVRATVTAIDTTTNRVKVRDARGSNDRAGHGSGIPHEHTGGRSLDVHASQATALGVGRGGAVGVCSVTSARRSSWIPGRMLPRCPRSATHFEG